MSNLLISEPPLQVLPTLAKLIGLNDAIVLQQIHFWLGISKNERYGLPWVYKTYPEWQQEFPFWSEDTVGRTIRRLEDLGLLIGVSWFNKQPMDKTKWYTIDYSLLEDGILPPRSPQVATIDDGKVPSSDDRKLQPSNHRKTTKPEIKDSAASPSKPKASRPDNPLFNAVAEHVFGLDPHQVNGDGGRIAKISTWLKKQDAPPEQLGEFTIWYRRKYPGISAPRDLAKFQEHWSAFRQGGLHEPVPDYSRGRKR